MTKIERHKKCIELLESVETLRGMIENINRRIQDGYVNNQNIFFTKSEDLEYKEELEFKVGRLLIKYDKTLSYLI